MLSAHWLVENHLVAGRASDVEQRPISAALRWHTNAYFFDKHNIFISINWRRTVNGFLKNMRKGYSLSHRESRKNLIDSQRWPDWEKFWLLSAGEIPTKMSCSTKTGNIRKKLLLWSDSVWPTLSSGQFTPTLLETGCITYFHLTNMFTFRV